MKILSGLIILVFPGLVIYGQQARTGKPTPATPPTPPVAAARILTEFSASAEKIVKGAPFSAEGVSESVQTLADGNHIVRKWSEKLYRSTDGKFRRESTGGRRVGVVEQLQQRCVMTARPAEFVEGKLSALVQGIARQ